MRNKNGFTLIELLAVIVILSIIAVITVPVIFDVIDKSKKATVIDSAYGYRDAINKFYMEKSINDDNFDIEDGEYDIEYFINQGLDVSGRKPSSGWVMLVDGDVKDFSIKFDQYVVNYDSSTDHIEAIEDGDIAMSPRVQAMNYAKEKVSTYLNQVASVINSKNYDEDKSFTVGDIITELGITKTSDFDDSSWVYLDYDPNVVSDNVSITNYSFKIIEGDFAFVIEKGQDGKPYVTDKIFVSPKAQALSNEFLNNIASYFSNDIDRVVYFDPVNGTVNCNNYVSNNSKPGFDGVVTGTNSTKTVDDQTSCLKWYKYSTNIDGTINMILDHNTHVQIKYYYALADNSYGPFSIMYYLTFSDWGGIPLRGDKYTAYRIENNGTKTVIFTNATDNTTSYIGKRARLITAQEIAIITGANATTSPGISWDEQNTSSSWFYLDSKNQSTASNTLNPSDFYWLYENIKDCEQYGCVNQNQNITSGNYGYWTSSPNANNYGSAWTMYYDGRLNARSVNENYFGIRPVITIPIS